jgi:hypothetical protein
MDPQFRFAHQVHSSGNPLLVFQEDQAVHHHNDHGFGSTAEPVAVAEQALGRHYLRLFFVITPTYGSGSGSCSFLQWPSRRVLLFKVTFTSFFKDKKS